MSSEVHVIEADLEEPEHARAIVDLTAAYAEDVMGNGGPLPAEVLERLVPALRASSQKHLAGGLACDKLARRANR